MKKLLLTLLTLFSLTLANAQSKKEFSVIAYYIGDAQQIQAYEVNKLTHIIFSFCHLNKDGKLSVDNSNDSLTIKALVKLKDKNPKIKVMLSLGGWGGCETCSEVFSTARGRELFANSVKEVNDYFQTDGIDLDWEYPAIEGLPGHLYQKEDKKNFTSLVVILRKVLGDKHEISFAAGGFQQFLDESIEWEIVTPLLDRINLMSYDLVNGYSKVTGHHTPLYSTKEGEESTDKAVKYLLNLGVPPYKIVIGAAFYTRVWENVLNFNNGLYQKGNHIDGYRFHSFSEIFTAANGWKSFRDEKAQAPYWYNSKEKKFATGDDKVSVKAKTNYALQKQLGGIMFWELTLDTPKGGLLNAIFEEVKD